MRVIVQRAKDAYCKIDGKIVGESKNGFMLLVGFTNGDTEADLDIVAKKVQGLRICADENGKMNKSLFDIGGSILSISQFTLYADITGGYRPSFTNAMKGELARPLYLLFNQKLREYGLVVEEGVFGADMEIGFINIGPTTIIIDSKDLKK